MAKSPQGMEVPAICVPGATVRWEDLPPTARTWVTQWVRGICATGAKGPPGEPERVERKQYEQCVNMFMEDKQKLARLAQRWQCRLFEVIAGPTASNGHNGHRRERFNPDDGSWDF